MRALRHSFRRLRAFQVHSQVWHFESTSTSKNPVILSPYSRLRIWVFESKVVTYNPGISRPEPGPDILSPQSRHRIWAFRDHNELRRRNGRIRVGRKILTFQVFSYSRPSQAFRVHSVVLESGLFESRFSLNLDCLYIKKLLHS
jgi:hypothetical protein